MGDRVVVSGASGLIGAALVESLRADGVRAVTLVRREARGDDEVRWLSDDEPLNPDSLAGATAVVNLGGASIGRLPWTRGYKRTLASSRLGPTGVLATAIRELGADAPAFVSASASGVYGDRPAETLTESSGQGTGFLTDLCAAWEREALAAGPHARVALLRTASVLHPRGMLRPLMLLARFGVAGPLGGGRQVWPWVSLVDEVRAIRHVIDAGLEGPVNLSGPTPATANEVGRAIARAMRRPFWLPVPAWALRLGLTRDAADSLLLADATVSPAALLESGFEFRHATAASAIEAELGV
ncbi:MAG TPA: TIGR01777 family oxidoreductase [Terrimesophilobacter sp.]|nr:TIGR01777 family oxidoreductase [Terrimesophilobacter sp.]